MGYRSPVDLKAPPVRKDVYQVGDQVEFLDEYKSRYGHLTYVVTEVENIAYAFQQPANHTQYVRVEDDGRGGHKYSGYYLKPIEQA